MASRRIEHKATELTKPKSGSRDSCKDTMLAKTFINFLVFFANFATLSCFPLKSAVF